MDGQVGNIDCDHVAVPDRPGLGHRLLEHIGEQRINLRGFTAIPTGEDETRICLVTESPESKQEAAADACATLNGPRQALLIPGDDRIGGSDESADRRWRVGDACTRI